MPVRFGAIRPNPDKPALSPKPASPKLGARVATSKRAVPSPPIPRPKYLSDKKSPVASKKPLSFFSCAASS